MILVCFVTTYFMRQSKSKDDNNHSTDQLFSLLIPFKNEKENILQLIEFLIENQAEIDEVIFINDHSDDNSFELVAEKIKAQENFILISNDDSQKGKKAALQNGLDKARNNFVLTWDADISPNSEYFKSPFNYFNTDLILFPVVMLPSKKSISSFFAYEYNLLSALNYLLSPFLILTGSGANLFFDKSKLSEEKNPYNSDIASGDDHYLLREFQESDKDVKISNQTHRSVYTKSVDSFEEYFKQRMRWLGKFKYKSSFSDILIGVFFGYWFLLSPTFLVLTLCDITHFYALLIVVFIQYFTYLLVEYNYKNKIDDLVLPMFFTITYPLLFITLLLRLTRYKNTW